LKEAIEKGYVSHITIAQSQTLLETAQLKHAEERETPKAANEIQKRVDKRKCTLLEYFAKKPKVYLLNSGHVWLFTF